MQANNIFDRKKLSLIINQTYYRINLYDNILWLYYMGNAPEPDNWETFYEKYENATEGATILLTGNISADQTSEGFGSPKNNLTIDAGAKMISGNEIDDLGFVLDQKVLTIKDAWIYKFASNNGAVLNLLNSRFNFEGELHLTDNKAQENGGVIYMKQSTMSLKNPITRFSANSANLGGAIFAESSSINFTGGIIYLMSNHAIDGGGAIFSENSNINFVNANANISINDADKGSGIFLNNSQMKVVNSTINFGTNHATSNGGAIFIGGISRIHFLNSQISFFNNTVGDEDIKNDIYIEGDMIFDGDVTFTNGIKTSGGGDILKTGNGKVEFLGEGSKIENRFTLRSGIARFISAQSTVNVLNVYRGASLSLSSDTINELFIDSDFLLEAQLILDFQFGDARDNGRADFISVNGNITIDKSTLTVNFLSTATVKGSSVAFMQGYSINNVENLFLNVSQPDYKIVSLEDGMLWLWLPTDWDLFNLAYQNGTGSVSLKEDLIVTQESAHFESPEGGFNNFTINGAGHIICSKDFEDFGFVFEESFVTFKDITISSFSRNGAGGAIKILQSTVNFRGAVSFIGNNAADNGGAIYVESSTIAFIDASVLFLANKVSDERSDIYFADESSILIFDGDVNFKNGLQVEGFGGAGQIKKVGNGKVTFAGEGSLIKNKFDLKAGEAVFQSNQSTVATMLLNSNAALSLKSGKANKVFIENDLTINDFSIITLELGDMIDVGGDLFVSPKSIWKIETFWLSPSSYKAGTKTNIVQVESAANIKGELNYEAAFISNGNSIRYGVYDTGSFPKTFAASNGESFNGLYVQILDIVKIIAAKMPAKFIANVVKQAAINNDEVIFANVKENFWASGFLSGQTIKDDEDIDAFKREDIGIKAGAKVFAGKDFLAGVFIGFDNKNFKQGDSIGKATDLSFGIYGSWQAAEKINFKANVGAAFENAIAKNAELLEKSDFEIFAIRFGAEMDYNAGLLKPFLGLQGAYVSSPKIIQKVEGENAATIDANDFLRLSPQAGLKIEGDAVGSKLNWFAKTYLGSVLIGNQVQYKVNPNTQGISAKPYTVDTSKEGNVFFGLGLGAGYALSKNIIAKLTLDLNFAGNASGYLANAGISYKF
jgi:predicted outer membrane repeat protein